MNRSLAQSLTVLAVALAALTAAGCQVEAVGDPCTPENIPVDGMGRRGFLAGEAYLETSSVQCRTRVCIVNDLRGGTEMVPADPSQIGCTEAGCVSQAEFDNSIYCTCRCDGPAGAADFCECPESFVCTQILASGGIGIVGSYCVKPKD